MKKPAGKTEDIMADTAENAPLVEGNLAGSADALATQTRPRGGSNSCALKVAGLTTLGCLLVASQVFVAYMVFDQGRQIQTLQRNADKMTRQLQAPQGVPIKKRVPANGHPLMNSFLEADAAVSLPEPKAPAEEEKHSVSAAVSVEEMMSLMEENFELPEFNDTIFGNLQSLKKHLNHSNWKSFESWMGNNILFQMAQLKAVSPIASPIKTKCQMQAEAGGSQLSSFRPACDQQGRYLATQCWRAIGMCWCVDVDTGDAMEDTVTPDRDPDCRVVMDDWD
ncbi:H-2 class II histocompatibility antigen gamma chain-like isoform X2 [Entelurus aequoreus]|uniref:H-2 class II histocompatibility antigen gamma chain-like isoform X2 n=1 Tax=Entelurus aequoreus TaxID=161455 RepID=UPI002B1D63C4|nr:H-2 class II histocompatibility antigen gamma chain-like isoform X2 [Entelurus aequoreus]